MGLKGTHQRNNVEYFEIRMNNEYIWSRIFGKEVLKQFQNQPLGALPSRLNRRTRHQVESFQKKNSKKFENPSLGALSSRPASETRSNFV